MFTYLFIFLDNHDYEDTCMNATLSVSQTLTWFFIGDTLILEHAQAEVAVEIVSPWSPLGREHLCVTGAPSLPSPAGEVLLTRLFCDPPGVQSKEQSLGLCLFWEAGQQH